MKLYVARHGETTWNVEKRVMGTLPGELSEVGKKQARELGKHIQNLGIDVGFVSDLGRTVQTAEIVKDLNPGINFTKTAALRERHLGDLEGKLFSEFNWDDVWKQSPDATPFNAESLNAYTMRVATFMLELEKYQDKTVLLIAHMGTMNRLHFLADPVNFEPQDYLNGQCFEYDFPSIYQHSKHFLNNHTWSTLHKQ